MSTKPESKIEDADEAIDLFDQLTRQNDALRAEMERSMQIRAELTEALRQATEQYAEFKVQHDAENERLRVALVKIEEAAGRFTDLPERSDILWLAQEALGRHNCHSVG